jgi:glycosyltransferase involved in cell wall biosynthesis
MIRSLYSTRPSPYYLVAPDYRQNSAGIRVMHMLCDALIRSGYEAYVTANVLSPRLMTPRLTADVIALHKAQKIEPIAVYPEVVSGNPMAANVVARYLLNKPGFIGGDGVFGEGDILFGYTKGLLLPGMPEQNVLFLQPVDLGLFQPPADPSVRVPGKVCYFQGRSGTGIDKALLADDSIEITHVYPASRDELVAIFQTCEFFYSSSTSALSAEAVLCGCVSVVIPGEGAPVNFSIAENGSYGVAWGLAPEEVERARQTMPLLRENLESHEVEFWPALDHFIEVTQTAATEYGIHGIKSTAAYWLERRVLSAAQNRLVDQHLQRLDAPEFTVVILDPEGSIENLTKTIESLAQHGNLKATFRPLVLTTANVANANASDHVFILDPSDYVGTINRAISGCTCDLFVITHAGEEFTAGGLLSAVLELSGAPGLRAVYADEVMRFEDGNLDLLLRPDINLDLLLSFPSSMARHWLFRRDVWQDMGGFDAQYQDAFELEFILRLIETTGFEGLGHISEPLVIADALMLQDNAQERAVIERHLRARGFETPQVGSRLAGRYELDYGHSTSPPVSILIVVDGQLAHAQRCVESLLENTGYNNFELLLLDRGNEAPLVVNWLSGINQLGAGHLRVLRFPGDLSAQMIRNQAATEARGEFLLFLDASIGVIGSDWLEQLLNHGMRPEVGGVGAKLIGADGKVCHGGLLLGLGMPVANPFSGMAADAGGYMQRLQVDQNYTALSGKCLMLRQELFAAVGGFDEQLQPWADVDLCIKLQQAGYLNVWTPRVQLLIGESDTTPATPEQEDRFYERWLPVLARDRAGNPNFSRVRAGAFAFTDSALSWRPLSTCKSVPIVLAHPADFASSSAQHRIIQPFNALRDEGLIEGVLTADLLSVVELERYNPDVILLQRQIGDGALDAMRRMKAFSRAFKVYDLDAYLPDLTMNSQSPDDVLESLRTGLSYMDRLLVPTEFMAQVFEGFNADIRVVKNRLDPRCWDGLPSKRRCADKPRVGWAGGLNNIGELEVVADVIKELANEVHWVILGACPEHLRPFVHEFHQGVAIDLYPAKLASLNLDLALAPLEDSLFNRCKSNLRLLEYGACGYPVICSNLEAYRDGLPVKRVENRFESWADAIRAHANDLDAAAALGDYLQARVRHDWMLDGSALAAWRDNWLGQ